MADNLVDHLSEIELRPAGVEPLPDRRHASAITTAADLAPFTEHDRPHRLGALLCAAAQTPR